MPDITPEYLRKRLRYDPKSGYLFWLDCKEMSQRWRTRYAGKRAFTAKGSHGYHHGSVLEVGLLAHRVIWAIQTGKWPCNQIDHKDTIRTNNKWDNLREATCEQNNRNKGNLKPATSGITGVLWDKRRLRWYGRITIHGKSIVSGYSKDIRVAISAREKLLEEYGFDPKHGKHHRPQ